MKSPGRGWHIVESVLGNVFEAFVSTTFGAFLPAKWHLFRWWCCFIQRNILKMTVRGFCHRFSGRELHLSAAFCSKCDIVSQSRVLLSFTTWQWWVRPWSFQVIFVKFEQEIINYVGTWGRGKNGLKCYKVATSATIAHIRSLKLQGFSGGCNLTLLSPVSVVFCWHSRWYSMFNAVLARPLSTYASGIERQSHYTQIIQTLCK